MEINEDLTEYTKTKKTATEVDTISRLIQSKIVDKRKLSFSEDFNNPDEEEKNEVLIITPKQVEEEDDDVKLNTVTYFEHDRKNHFISLYQESNKLKLEKNDVYKKTKEKLDPTNCQIRSSRQQKMIQSNSVLPCL